MTRSDWLRHACALLVNRAVAKADGGPGAIRTPDLLIRRPMVSSLFIILNQLLIFCNWFYYGSIVAEFIL